MTPQISISEIYNDNIYFEYEDVDQDFITQITPALNLTLNDDTSSLTSNTYLEIANYANENEKDTDKEKYDFYSGILYRYDPSELFYMNIESSFKRDASVDSELENTGLLINDQNIFVLKPALTWWVSERNLLNLSCSYQFTQYDESYYMDFHTLYSRLEFGRALLTEKAIVYLGGGYSHTNGEVESHEVFDQLEKGELNNYSFISGMDINANPNWIIQFRGGQRFISISYSPFLQVIYPESGYVRNEDLLTKIGNIKIKRLLERGYVSTEVKKDTVTSGQDIAIDRIIATFESQYFFTDRFITDMSVSWSQSESISNHYATDRNIYSLKGKIEYLFKENYSISLLYEKVELIDNTLDTTTVRNEVFINITAFWDHYI